MTREPINMKSSLYCVTSCTLTLDIDYLRYHVSDLHRCTLERTMTSYYIQGRWQSDEKKRKNLKQKEGNHTAANEIVLHECSFDLSE